jgi:hypothetical protein
MSPNPKRISLLQPSGAWLESSEREFGDRAKEAIALLDSAVASLERHQDLLWDKHNLTPPIELSYLYMGQSQSTHL